MVLMVTFQYHGFLCRGFGVHNSVFSVCLVSGIIILFGWRSLHLSNFPYVVFTFVPCTLLVTDKSELLFPRRNQHVVPIGPWIFHQFSFVHFIVRTPPNFFTVSESVCRAFRSTVMINFRLLHLCMCCSMGSLGFVCWRRYVRFRIDLPNMHMVMVLIPCRGCLAYGPVIDSQVDNDGHSTASSIPVLHW